jgi:outer membrane lipopolysaccharide assembly protein LptE/RlpB
MMICWLAVALMAAGCGYRFAGGGQLPGNIRRVAVLVLENRTSETGLENTLTNDLIYELTRNRNAQVVPAPQADARLSGSIRTLSVSSVSHSDADTSQERRVSVTVDLRLTDGGGETIWQRQGISANETYDVVASDKISTNQNRSEALKDLSKRLAERVYTSLTDNF